MENLHRLRVGTPEHRETSGVGVEDAHDHPDGRRLPRSVGTEKSVHRSVRHRERDVVHRGYVPEALGDTGEGDGVVWHASAPARPFGRAAWGGPSSQPRWILYIRFGGRRGKTQPRGPGVLRDSVEGGPDDPAVRPHQPKHAGAQLQAEIFKTPDFAPI